MSSCIIWPGARSANGYGRTWRHGVHAYAHRVAYEAVYGPIPAGMHVHHICGEMLCVNVEHLAVVSPSVHNTIHHGGRETCKRGHAFTADNTYTYRGERHCRECKRAAWRRYYHRRKVAA